MLILGVLFINDFDKILLVLYPIGLFVFIIHDISCQIIHPSSEFAFSRKSMAVFEHSVENRLNQVFACSFIVCRMIQKNQTNPGDNA
jgi:hypothetical protein